MSITLNLFGYQALTEAVNQMQPVPRFITDLLFKRQNTNATKTILVDIMVAGQKIAPFVKRGNPAKVLGNLGQKTNQVEPPEIRLKKFLKPDDLFYTRGAGVPIFIPGGTDGSSGIEQARVQRIAMEQSDLKDVIDRTVEMLCCLGLSGAYTLTQDDVVFSIDFSMPDANKPTLSVNSEKWTAKSTCKPLKNIRDWKTVAQKASGKIPSIAIMNSATWELFIDSDNVSNYLNKLKIDIGMINTDQAILYSGAEKRARIDQVDYYVYDGVYTNSEGQQMSMIPDNKVALVSPNADYRLEYAGVDDLDAGTVVGKYFSKDWIEKDPSGLWLMVESHPLPCFNEPAANIWATVV